MRLNNVFFLIFYQLIIISESFFFMTYFYDQEKFEHVMQKEKQKKLKFVKLKNKINYIAREIENLIENNVNKNFLTNEQIVAFEIKKNNKLYKINKENVENTDQFFVNTANNHLYLWVFYNENIKFCIKFSLNFLKKNETLVIFNEKTKEILKISNGKQFEKIKINNLLELKEFNIKEANSVKVLNNISFTLNIKYSLKNFFLESTYPILLAFFLIIQLLHFLMLFYSKELFVFFSCINEIVFNGKFAQTNFFFKEMEKLTNEIHENQIAKKQLQKYVPNKIANRFDKNFILTNQHKNTSILFTDIRNFTNIMEIESVDSILEKLNEYFNIIEKIIKNKEGILDKYIGDSAMAFWEQENHANLACICALQIVKLMQEKNFFQTNIGISSGESIVGNIGNENRLQYTVMGQDVNFASRLESLNKVYNTKILINHSTFLEATEILARPVDSLTLRGSNKKTIVYEVITLKKHANHAQQKLFNLTQEAFKLMQQNEFEKAKEIYFELKLLNDHIGEYWHNELIKQTHIAKT